MGRYRDLRALGNVLLGMLAVAALIGIVALGRALTFNQLGMASFFDPKFEQVRRDTFETPKAYRGGMAPLRSSALSNSDAISCTSS